MISLLLLRACSTRAKRRFTPSELVTGFAVGHPPRTNAVAVIVSYMQVLYAVSNLTLQTSNTLLNVENVPGALNNLGVT